jgi:hypothetical protein
MNLKIISSILLVLLLSACDSGELWRDGEYLVAWINDGKPYLAHGMSDDAHETVIGKTVESIGSNDWYIVVERNLATSDKHLYYIIDKNLNYREAIVGPINITEFKVMKHKLELPEFSESF